MDRKRMLFPCGLIATCSYLATSIDTSFALDRPLHTASLVLLVSGIAIIIFGIVTARTSQTHHKARYEPVSAYHGDEKGHVPTAKDLDMKKRLLLAITLLLLICGRVSIFWRITKDIECVPSSALPSLPLILAIYTGRHDIKTLLSKTIRQPHVLKELASYFTFTAASRHVLPALLLWMATRSTLKATTWPSTYICPMANGTAVLIPRLHFLGSLIDCAMLVVLYTLFREREVDNDNPVSLAKNTAKSAALVGISFIASALFLATVGVFLYLQLPEHRDWILTTPSHYSNDTLLLCLAIPCTIMFFLFTMRDHGFFTTFFIAAFSLAYTQVFRLLHMDSSYGFPPKPTFHLVFQGFIITLAVFLYILVESGVEFSAKPKMPLRFGRLHFILLSLVLLVLGVGVFGLQRHMRSTSGHPITELIELAKEQHTSWAMQANQSDSFSHAERNYRRRYNRQPPRGFKKWYDFATDKNSVILDDFDNIEEDLAPFASLSPGELQKRTAAIIKDNHNVGGIRIKEGKASFFGDVPPTHKWMLDGVIQMIEKFAKYLPDMEMAMNLNDESRVAIPYSTLKKVKPQWESYSSVDEFGRARVVPDDSEPHDRFTYYPGFNPTFHAHGAISCPPGSPALTKRHWKKNTLCITCAAPHSTGVFVSNWSMSPNPCHQPDLADLHGLHLSPSAMVGTHALIPLFSQSKAVGYADIRLPSPWNYLAKTHYSVSKEFPDPVFSEKENILFWRGTTTEGVSPGSGAWKGMLRQRLVHLANNVTGPPQLISLPLGRNTPQFSTVFRDPATIRQKLGTKLDIRFVGEILRCGGDDCPDQDAEFSPSEDDHVDFQQHWRYRYLFDADGAGFSGRFVPFLHSNSVVLKTALFRQWYEGRLTAWHHFIPIDLRLHDLFSVLAYFGGWRNDLGRYFGGRIWEGREREALAIAKQSREWAGKVLRKEDMEIYMFRLMLEWGRLVGEERGKPVNGTSGAGRVGPGKEGGTWGLYGID